jgi:superfamily II DNA or RNA helicase
MTKASYFYQYSSTVIQNVWERKTKLFEHQQKALLKLLEMGVKGELSPDHQSERKAAFLLIGVGCGKTVILQAAPYMLGQHIRGRQVIFLSDNCTLRKRVIEDFPTDNKHRAIQDKWHLYNLRLLPYENPSPQIVELESEKQNIYSIDLSKPDILVSNRQFLINLVKNQTIDPDNVGLIVVDEAHHSAASTYRTIFNYFSNSSLVFLTGTRHRGDSERLPFVRYETVQQEEENGQIVLKQAPRPDFEFSIQDAWKLQQPILKRITFSSAKSEGFKIKENGEEVEYTAELFYEKAEKERAWFRDCILADSFCKPVLDRAVEILQTKRKQNHPHRMIIRALNIKHAYRLYELCQDYELLQNKVGIVHSKNDEYDLEGKPSAIFEKFYKDEYIALIHVSMVGEGFNVPYASVSVPLCIMRSMQKAEQEFGRIIRKVNGTYPEDDGDIQSDNLAIVVTHEALGIGEIFEQFRAGVEYLILEDEENDETSDVVRSRYLTDDYFAGQAILHLNSTDGISPGDEVRVQDYDNEGKEAIYSFLVEEVVGKGEIKVFPLLVDIPVGSLARKANNREENIAQFVGHLGLQWYLLIDGQYISVEEYRRRKALEQRNLTLDQQGEITTSEGKRVSDLAPEFRQMVLDLVLQEEAKVDIPFQQLVSCRPDLEKKELQQYHLKRIKKSIYDVSLLTLDGIKGKNLINHPLELLETHINKSTRDNYSLLCSGILGHVKRTTGKKWQEYQTEEEFETAVRIAFKKIEEVREELKARRRSATDD